MIKQWEGQLRELSGNLTTNEAMPERLISKLLEEDESLKEELSFEEVSFAGLPGTLNEIQGLDILAGLQHTVKEGYLTVFRAIRFPTYKRMHEIVSVAGFAMSNYEQERIMELYRDENYIEKRTTVQSDPRFWIIPQERVVHGLPVFCLANDALQIHRAFRGDEDNVVIVAIHIPKELLETGKIKLTANTAIDLDYANEDRNFEIKDFITKNGQFQIDYSALRARGIDLHEMYSQELPQSIKEAEALGIEQEFFLLDIYKIIETDAINAVFNDSEILSKNKSFLYGFFGDQNIFGRRRTKFLPFKCSKLSKKTN